MMTAQNKHTPADAERSHNSAAAVDGFGKVINSIQGLQQRLSDFSIEVIAAAETNANTLISRLALLQNKLDELARLKRALADAEAMIKLLPQTDYDLIGPANLEKHPQLHAIVNASKIIRLHKLLKVARASADSVSFDSEIGRLDIASPLAPAIAATKEEKYPQPSAKSPSETISERYPTTGKTAKESSAGVIELPPPPTSNENERSVHGQNNGESVRLDSVKDDLSELPIREAESIPIESLASSPAAPSEEVDQLSDDIAAPAATPIDETPIVETKSENPGDRAAVDLAMTARESSQEPKAAVSPEMPRSQPDKAAKKAKAEIDNDRAWAAFDSVFDQRLLDELIQSYGEIVPSAKSSAPPAPAFANRYEAASEPIYGAVEHHEVRESRGNASATAVEPPLPPEPNFIAPEPLTVVDAAAVETAVSESRGNASATAVEPSLPPEPNFVAPEPVTVVDAAAVETVGVNVPSVRATDDLDRQLKKIIKEYGEYDIYSQQTSTTLKKSGIAAFIVLALVLGAVYFMWSPAQTAPTQANPVLQSGQDSSPTAPQATNENSRVVDTPGGVGGGLMHKGEGEKATKAAKTKTQQKP
jgi:hypothetical protein